MRKTKCIVCGVALALAASLVLGGCLPVLDFDGDNGAGNTTQYQWTESTTIPTASQTTSYIPTGDCPTISDPLTLKNYLNHAVRNGNMSPTFVYTGRTVEGKYDVIAQMLSTYSVSVNPIPGKANGWRVDVTNYPGDRVVAAYRSGNTSTLSADERAVLQKAMQIVAQAKAKAKNEMELELLLHDWVCDNVTYLLADTSIPSNGDINRPLTAIGALLDGVANCQGYSDGFFVLASLAGFTVDRQSTTDHMFNTIYLDNAWYIVDVEFADDGMATDPSLISYYLFNAGMDHCTEYSWDAKLERNPISAVSSARYFYNLPQDGSAYGYPKTFTSPADAAYSVVQQWAANGRAEQHFVLLNQTIDSAKFNEYMYDAANAAGVVIEYTTWVTTYGKDTYCYTTVKKYE